MNGSGKQLDLAALAARIPDGAKIALPSDFSGAPMAAVEALITRRARNLHIVVIPSGGIHVDLLIGAGCGAVAECAAVSLGDHGLAPRVRAAVERGE